MHSHSGLDGHARGRSSAKRRLPSSMSNIPPGNSRPAHRGVSGSGMRQSERAKKWLERQEKKRGKGKALSILAAKLGRAVYHVLHKKVAFDEQRFWAS